MIDIYLLKLLRWIPSFRGKLRLANMIFSNRRPKIKDLEISLKNGLKVMLPNIVEHSCFELAVNGYYERETINILSQNLMKSQVFVDVGANIGAVSIQLSAVRPDVKIIAIEASPYIYQYLKKNISLNRLHNITTTNIAINSKPGGCLPFFSPKDKIGCGSFSPTFTQDSVMVQCESVDSVFKSFNISAAQVGIIKIDIEGHEAKAFYGATAYMSLPTSKFYFEFVDWAEELAGFEKGCAQQFLLDNGFTLKATNPDGTLYALTTPLKSGYSMILATKG